MTHQTKRITDIRVTKGKGNTLLGVLVDELADAATSGNALRLGTPEHYSARHHFLTALSNRARAMGRKLHVSTTDPELNGSEREFYAWLEERS